MFIKMFYRQKVCVRYTSYIRLRTSYQIRKIVDCASPGMIERFSPPTTSNETASLRFRHAYQHVRHVRALMHVGMANQRWRGKRSRHSRRNPLFYVCGKRRMVWNYSILCGQQYISHCKTMTSPLWLSTEEETISIQMIGDCHACLRNFPKHSLGKHLPESLGEDHWV